MPCDACGCNIDEEGEDIVFSELDPTVVFCSDMCRENFEDEHLLRGAEND